MITIWRKIDEKTSELVEAVQEESQLKQKLEELRQNGEIYFAEKYENGMIITLDV